MAVIHFVIGAIDPNYMSNAKQQIARTQTIVELMGDKCAGSRRLLLAAPSVMPLF
jgi:hypothetical protein